MVYIAPTDTGSSGDGWVKLYEDGYDSSTDTWAVTTLIANKGKHSITIPDIAAGTYLLRGEIIALHEASSVGGAQFYME
jgi:cellulase